MGKTHKCFANKILQQHTTWDGSPLEPMLQSRVDDLEMSVRNYQFSECINTRIQPNYIVSLPNVRWKVNDWIVHAWCMPKSHNRVATHVQIGTMEHHPCSMPSACIVITTICKWGNAYYQEFHYVYIFNKENLFLQCYWVDVRQECGDKWLSVNELKRSLQWNGKGLCE